MQENNENNRRFIEQYLPIKELNESAQSEKGNSPSKISTIHRWWARRRQGVSRATILASLLDYASSNEEFEEIKENIIQICYQSNRNDPNILENSKKLIRRYRKEGPITFWDPFSGGGTIPAEAHRLGLEVYASDLNPVSVLIQKASYEFPSKYGMLIEDGADKLSPVATKSVLGNGLRKWGKWVCIQAKKELEKYYPADESGLIPSVYFWCHTVQCGNKSCGKQMPLQKQPWLSTKKNVAVSIFANPGDNTFYPVIVYPQAVIGEL